MSFRRWLDDMNISPKLEDLPPGASYTNEERFAIAVNALMELSEAERERALRVARELAP